MILIENCSRFTVNNRSQKSLMRNLFHFCAISLMLSSSKVVQLRGSGKARAKKNYT